MYRSVAFALGGRSRQAANLLIRNWFGRGLLRQLFSGVGPVTATDSGGCSPPAQDPGEQLSRQSPAEPVSATTRLGPSKKCHCRTFASSAGHNNEEASGHELLSPETSSSHRSLISFLIPTALLGIVGVAGYVRHNDERRAVNKGEGTREGITVKGPTIGGPFTLINTARQIVTEQNLRGNWVLLYFGYTSSPDVGPAEVQKMAKAVDILESNQNVKLLPVFVTLDPQRDSPSQLNAYLREFDSRIVGLTGPVNSIRQMAQEYRVFFKKVEEDGNDYLIESSHNMYLMNQNMEIVRCFGMEYSAMELAEAIGKELKRSST